MKDDIYGAKDVAGKVTEVRRRNLATLHLSLSLQHLISKIFASYFSLSREALSQRRLTRFR